MASLASASNAEKILKEFQSYIRHHNTTFVCATIRAVGRVADAAPSCAGVKSVDYTDLQCVILLVHC